MRKMALAISTDGWSKLSIYSAFLATHQPAVWRTRVNFKQETLNQLPTPINLYFFYRNEIRWRGRCSHIYHRDGWDLADVPSEFHTDATPYRMFILLDHLARVAPTHISAFPKWRDNPTAPKEYYGRGQQGLLKVEDIQV